MPKASINLADGTTVQIEGSAEEVAKILALYGGTPSGSGTNPKGPAIKKNQKNVAGKNNVPKHNNAESDGSPDLSTIIQIIKDCNEAENIETTVLDKIGQVNRILLPLFIVHKYMDNAYGLTSGEVSQITTQLGIPVQTPNASKTLSETASKYVIGNKVRKQGQPVRYKLSRRGVQYFKDVLDGTANDKQK